MSTDAPVFCVNHPKTETLLRCNKCGKPVCIKCVVRTPVGYRCKECLNIQHAGYYTATPMDYVMVAAGRHDCFDRRRAGSPRRLAAFSGSLRFSTRPPRAASSQKSFAGRFKNGAANTSGSSRARRWWSADLSARERCRSSPRWVRGASSFCCSLSERALQSRRVDFYRAGRGYGLCAVEKLNQLA